MNRNITVFIDGIVYSLQWFGGLITYWDNIILHVGDSNIQDMNVSFIMSLAEKNFFCSQKLTKHLTLVSEDPGQDYDLFHSTYYTLPKNSKAKRVLTFHDTIYEDFPEYFANHEGFESFMQRKKLCVKTADHIVAVSNVTKSKLLKYYEINPSQVTVIHHGISSIFHNARRLKDICIKEDLKSFSNSSKFLLFVGGRRFYKNFISLLKAYAISKVNRNFDLVVVGSEDSFFEEEREIIEQYKLQGKVKLLGFVKLEELVSIYLSAHGLIFPTMAEGFGLPLIEAMACEIPIACSDIPVFREIAGDLPIYFNPYDIDSLVTKIEELVSDDLTSRTIRGKEKSLNFQWQDSVNKLMDVYSLSL
jgi:glycosyltransferase involved in cell wall biosynthesis